MPAVKMASNWVPVCSVCGSSPCAFTHCQTCKHLFLSLGLSRGLRFFRERESWWHSGFTPTPLDREFARICELWVVSTLLVLLKAGLIPHLLDTCIQENLDCVGEETVLIAKVKSPTTFLVTQDPCSQNSICSSCREQTALSLHSTLGEGRIYG